MIEMKSALIDYKMLLYKLNGNCKGLAQKNETYTYYEEKR